MISKNPLDGTAPQPLDARMTDAYKSLVGSLNHIARTTRPDLSETVGQLCRHLAAPCHHHMSAARHALRYVYDTRDLTLKYSASAPQVLIAFADANFAADPDTRRSTTGYTIMNSGASVTWSSRIQKTVAQSTCEAEYISIATCANEVAHLLRLAQELGSSQHTITLHNDNSASNLMVSDPFDRRNTRHIDVRYHKIREYVDSGIITMKWVQASEMIADQLTKSLPPIHVQRCRDIMLGHQQTK